MKPTGRRSLTDQQAKEIITQYQTGQFSQSELAKQFNVSQATISNIITLKLYAIPAPQK